ncbi:MAG: hypothetical protein WCD49_11630 [Candidatus Acidiferrales bacterium]
MRKKILALAALPLVLAFLGGCGSSGHSVPPPSNNVPVVVSISDTTPALGETLPPGVNLVSTQATVTGVCLLTSSDTGVTTCPTGQAAFPATGGGPSTLQFAFVPTPSQPDVISNGAVTANTYTGALVTFGSPLEATISVDPGDSFSDGTTAGTSITCDNTGGETLLFCPVAPVLSTTSATVTFANPIVLTAGTPVSIVVGLDVTGSLTASTATPPVLSVTPIVSVTQGANAADGDLIDVSNVTGSIQSISATSITLADGTTGLPLTLNIGSGTTVSNYNNTTATCATPNTIACPQVGDVVTLSYGASNTNPVQFTAININGNPGITSTNGFQGTIIVAGEAPEVVVTAVPAGSTLSGIAVGQVYDLSFTDGAAFTNSTGAALPESFASATDLVVGQNVLVDVACTTNAGVTTCDFTPPAAAVPPAPQGAGSITADAIELLPSTIPGLLNTAPNPGYTVDGLSSFYTNNGVTALNGTTTASTTYSGTLTGFDGLTADETYYYTGFLLNSGTASDPDLFTTSIFGGPTSESEAVKAKHR